MKRVAMCGGADPHSLRCARFSKPAPEPSGFTHHMASKPSQEIVDGSDLDRRTDEQTRRQNLPAEIFQRIFIMIQPCPQNTGSVYLSDWQIFNCAYQSCAHKNLRSNSCFTKGRPACRSECSCFVCLRNAKPRSRFRGRAGRSIRFRNRRRKA